MKISYFVRALKFKYPFRIAHGMRTHTDCIYVKIVRGNFVGYGEATMPPYLSDNLKTSIELLDQLNLLEYTDDLIHPDIISEKINQQFEGNYSIKAAINIALWDLKGKIENTLVSNYFSTNSTIPFCTYTIGVGDAHEMKEKLNDATNFELIKLKLDGIHDQQIIETYLTICNKPFAVDANQAWSNIVTAEKMLCLLQNTNCFLIEQPFVKSDLELSKQLKHISKIPIIADEAFQHIDELENLADSFDGINIKLMKCGGISTAFQIIEKAKNLNLKILIGCMSESACGCAAASSLQSFANWVDLDGPYLISNNPFRGYEVKNGKIHLQYSSGLGLLTDLF